MGTVVVLAHGLRSEALNAASALVSWLEASGHRAVLPPSTAAALGRRDAVHDGMADADADLADADPADADLTGADLAVSLGGDGTMLRAFALVAAAGVPVLGVNVGHLGYLTEFELEEMIPTAEAALAGRLPVSERMMVAAWIRRRGCDEFADPDTHRLHADARMPAEAAVRPQTGQPWLGLNEVVVEKSEFGRTVRIDVSLDGEPFCTYPADGLIVSTPTGSTAYNLSAGGAVVAPTNESLQITPVAPHMFFDRSLVLDAATVVGLRVVGERAATVAADGREVARLAPGDELAVKRAEQVARLVTAGADSFHRVLKHKFGLQDR